MTKNNFINFLMDSSQSSSSTSMSMLMTNFFSQKVVLQLLNCYRRMHKKFQRSSSKITTNCNLPPFRTPAGLKLTPPPLYLCSILPASPSRHLSAQHPRMPLNRRSQKIITNTRCSDIFFFALFCNFFARFPTLYFSSAHFP